MRLKPRSFCVNSRTSNLAKWARPGEVWYRARLCRSGAMDAAQLFFRLAEIGFACQDTGPNQECLESGNRAFEHLASHLGPRRQRRVDVLQVPL